jgi:hypothetical protein
MRKVIILASALTLAGVIGYVCIQRESVLVQRRAGRSSQPKLVAGQELTLIGDV